MRKILIAIFALLIISACGEKKPYQLGKIVPMNIEMKAPATVSDIQAVDDKTTSDQNTKTISKKIIKEGDISFETNDVYATRKAIYNSLQRINGYIAEENEANNSDNGRKEYILKARVPAKNFDLFLNNVSANAERIDTKNIRIKDVTTQYIDISTQLANKKKLEDRYLELLKRGDKISDLLQIENKLSEIQTDIESTQGQLNYLIKQVEYSSLDITFYSRQIIKDNGKNFGFRLKSSLSDGWDTLGGMFFGLVGLWPVLLITIALYFIVKSWRKRRLLQRNKAVG